VPGRVDNVTEPSLAAALLVARRGQAYYSRKLNELHDADFDGPSLLPGWTRRHVIAHVGLNARALTRLTEWAATGIENPMYASPGQRREEIDMAATLPVQALRNLSDHAAIHLNVEWRDLKEDDWAHPVRTASGRTVPVSETVWMRTREVWIHAVDLNNGGSFQHFPPDLLDALLTDVVSAWSRRAHVEDLPTFVLQPVDRGQPVAMVRGQADQLVLSGTAAQLVRWATGRGFGGVELSGGGLPPKPPSWL
jgi:maleylpyruvate isomerase